MARAHDLHRWQLAAVRRSGHLAIALVGRDEVLELLRFPAKGEEMETAIRVAIESVADEYGVTTVVVEPGSLIERVLAKTSLTLRPIGLGDAAAAVVPDVPRDQRSILTALVDRFPRLARHVVVLRATGAVACAPDQRWRTVLLLAALLGLAGRDR